VFDISGGKVPLTPRAEFVVGNKPWDPVFSPDGKRAYFSLFADSTVAEVDFTGAGAVTRRIGSGLSQPYDMIMRADGKYLFVVNQNLAPIKPGASAHDNMPGMGASATPGAGAGFLSVIDVATGKVVKTLMLGAGPTGMGAAGAR
jgi:DNA-binding beta-propeller fold protein YncE